MSPTKLVRCAGAISLLAILLALSGCKVDVRDGAKGEAKKVDIETPAGSLHVRESASVSDTGLEVYPGATEIKESGEKQGANVSLEGPGFGVKLVAVKFHSKDGMDKVAGYYRDQLKKFGSITECKGDINFAGQGEHRRVTCREDNTGKLSLAVSSDEENQRIVALKPRSDGTEFAIVYISGGKDKGTI